MCNPKGIMVVKNLVFGYYTKVNPKIFKGRVFRPHKRVPCLIWNPNELHKFLSQSAIELDG